MSGEPLHMKGMQYGFESKLHVAVVNVGDLMSTF